MLEFKLIINGTPNKWQPVESDRCTDGDKSLTGSTCICFLHKVSQEKSDHTHAVKVKTVLNGQGKEVTINMTLKKMTCNKK
jgi:hypothetical protein